MCSRREADEYIGRGLVFVDGVRVEELGARIDPAQVITLAQAARAEQAGRVTILLHKPVGYTCSSKDRGRVVYDLLPPRFALRSPVLSTVGRLDRETSGLLLLTDDGQLLHRIIAPKSKLPKVYLATLANALRGDEAAIFASGTLMLESEQTPLLPAELEVLDAHRARLTLHEGRYHQVRRMFAAVGNHVQALHRSRIGGLTLGDLAPGQWRLLDQGDLRQLFGAEA